MFNLRDRVRIRKGSKYYGRNVQWNPADVDGVVTRVNGSAYYVKWDTGYINTYLEHNLEYAKSLEELMEEYLCQS